jgi:hypothetical protein
MLRKLLTLTLAVVLAGLFAAVVYAAVESGDGSPTSGTIGTTDLTGTTDTTDTTDTTETTTTDTTTTETTTTPQGGVDISGPCDEPEHFNDPRCTGAPDFDDHGGNSGPGGGDDWDDDFDDDDSGRGRGRGRGRGGDD